MGNKYMNVININDEQYLTLNDAENYLDEPSAIFELGAYFFKYKGFATQQGCLDEPIIINHSLDFDPDMAELEVIDETRPEKVYIDGIAEIAIQPLKQAYHDAADVYISEFQEFIGLVNGKQSKISLFWSSTFIRIPQQLLNLYDGSNYNDDILVKLSDLDALAEKYGIPKRLEDNINSEVAPIAVSKAPPARGLLVIKEPSNKNEKYKAIKKCIDIFESENGFTPSFDELYPRLVDTKHSNDEVFTWDLSCKQNAKDCYKRYYPASSGSIS